MKRLRDALLAGATIALLLYAAMTAARSVTGKPQGPLQASAAPAQRLPLLAGRRRRDEFMQLARRD